MPDVIPFLTYEDGIAALEWLAKAFGFTETARLTSSDGRLSHGEMSVGDSQIMLASPSPDYQGPKRHRVNCATAAAWSALPWIIDGVLVYVDDVDAHYARAKAAGAVILSEPEDGPPARRYRAEDLEGHRWMFMHENSGERTYSEPSARLTSMYDSSPSRDTRIVHGLQHTSQSWM